MCPNQSVAQFLINFHTTQRSLVENAYGIKSSVIGTFHAYNAIKKAIK